MLGTVHIPNPSVMTLDLGNVTMPNLVLKPGENTVPMQARVAQATLLSMVLSTYKDAILPLEISGNSSIKNGQHLTYYEEAIKANTVKLDLNAGPALSALGINITSSA
jgi:hypothetical protein